MTEKSIERLAQCHPDLIKLFVQASKHRSLIVTCGHRGKEEQDRMFAEGKSKVKFPDSKHNSVPSMAADFCPVVNGQPMWGIEYVLPLGGFIMGLGAALGLSLRWGHDWDGDGEWKDQTFHDRVHIELLEKG